MLITSLWHYELSNSFFEIYISIAESRAYEIYILMIMKRDVYMAEAYQGIKDLYRSKSFGAKEEKQRER